MGDLLPCPFCGSASVGEPIRRRPLQVACIDCGSEGPEALTHDDARDRWNGRTMADTVDRLTRERDEARALLADAARPPVATATLTAIRAWLEATNA